MSQVVQQVIAPTFVDIASVQEAFVNGPMSININGQVATLTFTVMRGDLEQSMSSQKVTKATATVASRLAMPLHNLIEMRDLLNRVVPNQPNVSGLQTKQ